MNKRIDKIASVLPPRMAQALTLRNIDFLEEIRIKLNSPVLVYESERESYLTDSDGNIIIPDKSDIDLIVENITKNSLYAYLDDIRKGFVTIEGGHRIGICGTAVYENNRLINIKNIAALNIRVAKEIKGVSDSLMSYIYYDNLLKNTLIISPPQVGKTTLIRDISRNLSGYKNMKIALIDERDEIAAGYMGIPQNDVGKRTFVLSGYDKKTGFDHAIRSLSPNVIICDEIGTEEDLEIIKDALLRGVKIIATIHGKSTEDISLRNNFAVFERIITLDKNYPNRIKNITDGDFNEL